jgi:hypothetical protein
VARHWPAGRSLFVPVSRVPALNLQRLNIGGYSETYSRHGPKSSQKPKHQPGRRINSWQHPMTSSIRMT